MSRPLLSSGQQDHTDSLPPDERHTLKLEEENRELRKRVRDLEMELDDTKKINARAVSELQKLLDPFRRALQMIYNEIEVIGCSSSDTTSPSAGNSKWDIVKQRLSPRLREAVDILLVQGTMNRTQLAASLKMDYSNCIRNVIQVLKSRGLLVDDGRELRLKEL